MDTAVADNNEMHPNGVVKRKEIFELGDGSGISVGDAGRSTFFGPSEGYSDQLDPQSATNVMDYVIDPVESGTGTGTLFEDLKITTFNEQNSDNSDKKTFDEFDLLANSEGVDSTVHFDVPNIT